MNLEQQQGYRDWRRLCVFPGIARTARWYNIMDTVWTALRHGYNMILGELHFLSTVRAAVFIGSLQCLPLYIRQRRWQSEFTGSSSRLIKPPHVGMQSTPLAGTNSICFLASNSLYFIGHRGSFWIKATPCIAIASIAFGVFTSMLFMLGFVFSSFAKCLLALSDPFTIFHIVCGQATTAIVMKAIRLMSISRKFIKRLCFLTADTCFHLCSISPEYVT